MFTVKYCSQRETLKICTPTLAAKLNYDAKICGRLRTRDFFHSNFQREISNFNQFEMHSIFDLAQFNSRYSNSNPRKSINSSYQFSIFWLINFCYHRLYYSLEKIKMHTLKLVLFAFTEVELSLRFILNFEAKI